MSNFNEEKKRQSDNFGSVGTRSQLASSHDHYQAIALISFRISFGHSYHVEILKTKFV